MDHWVDQHAVADVINCDAGDIFIVIEAAVDDDTDTLKGVSLY
jgi:hypothetical protein